MTENEFSEAYKKEEKLNDRLFKYLLWGQTTHPARFRYLSEYQTWATGIGFDADQCREPWELLKTVFRPLYGEPVFSASKV
jgi:hypothetical protein